MNLPPQLPYDPKVVEKYRPLVDELKSRVLKEPELNLADLFAMIMAVPSELSKEVSEIPFVGFLVEAPKVPEGQTDQPTPPTTQPPEEGTDTGESGTP